MSMSIILLQYKKIALGDLSFCLFARALFFAKHDIA